MAPYGARGPQPHKPFSEPLCLWPQRRLWRVVEASAEAKRCAWKRARPPRLERRTSATAQAGVFPCVRGRRRPLYVHYRAHLGPGRDPIDEVLRGLAHALDLIVSGDRNLLEIVLLTFRVSGIALLFSAAVGIPMGAVLGLTRFPGRRLVTTLLYTGMGFPPVVIGLAVYILLSRSGPLGALGWAALPALFTPAAMIVAQAVISFPLVAGFTMAAVMGVDPYLRRQLQSLGATPLQTALTLLAEARVGVMVSVIAGFGSIISEVGAVMLVGGNIEHRTRVLTTAIVLETRKGDFALAIALGAILLALSFMVNLAMLSSQGRRFSE